MSKHFFENNDDNEDRRDISMFDVQIDEYPDLNNKTPNVFVFNLSKNLDSTNLYQEIICKKSLTYIVQTFLCIHDTRQDIHISGAIWKNGVWEPHVFKPFMDFVKERPDSLVIDIGANIGYIFIH